MAYAFNFLPKNSVRDIIDMFIVYADIGGKVLTYIVSLNIHSFM